MAATSMNQQSEQKELWNPLQLNDILERFGLTDRKVAILLLAWIGIIALCLATVLFLVPEDIARLNIQAGQINSFYFLALFPAMGISILIMFWLGFEWGFIPAFLSKFIIAQGTGMEVYWSLLFAFSVVLGLAIYALTYYSTPISYNLRSVKSLAFFVGVSFAASMASSLGVFIWSHAHGLPLLETMLIWQGWWSGMFLMAILIVGPLLFIVGSRAEYFKFNTFHIEPRPEISLKWIYTSIFCVVGIVAAFLWANDLLGSLRVQEELARFPDTSRQAIESAVDSFGIITWISVFLVFSAGMGGIQLIGSWNKNLREQVAERTRELQESKRKLRKSLTDKEILLKEVHHRVKNNFASVSALLEMQAMSQEDENVEEILMESKSRIDSMAMVHRHLYQTDSLSDIDLKDYVLRLSDSIRSMIDSSTQRRIQFHENMDNIHVPVEYAIPCGLLVNEILINVFKHAFPEEQDGNVYIYGSMQGSQVTLAIQDDGQGLPQEAIDNESQSLGMSLIHGFARKLDARLSVENRQGAYFRIDFTYEPNGYAKRLENLSKAGNGAGNETGAQT